MRLTEQTRYALRVLTYCAERDPQIVQVSSVAQETGLTDHTIYKLLKIATREGVIRSARGRKGGIRLARPPHEVTVGAVVRMFEPRFRECGPAALLSDPSPQSSADRRLDNALGAGLRAFLAAYDDMTLADLARAPDGAAEVGTRGVTDAEYAGDTPGGDGAPVSARAPDEV